MQGTCEVHHNKRSACMCGVYSLHKFPVSLERRREWVVALNRKDFEPSKFARVCSVHFVDGKPTKINPTPRLKLGSAKKAARKRSDGPADPKFQASTSQVIQSEQAGTSKAVASPNTDQGPEETGLLVFTAELIAPTQTAQEPQSVGGRNPCCVVGCEADDWCNEKEWHTLPKKSHLRAAWLQLIGHTESSLPLNPHVCGRHFAPFAYNYSPASVGSTGVGTTQLRLKANSLPTLFLPGWEGQAMESAQTSQKAVTSASSQGPPRTYLLLSTAKHMACAPKKKEHRPVVAVTHRCCVVGCGAIDRGDIKMWHVLPIKPTLRAAWLELIGCSESSLPPNPRVCGRHFARETYNCDPASVERLGTGSPKPRLKANSLPTLFLPEREIAQTSQKAATPASSQGPPRMCLLLSTAKHMACAPMKKEHRPVERTVPCCVVGCEAVDRRNVKVRHALPRKPTLRAAWLQLIGCAESSLAGGDARVCGRHFAPDAYTYDAALVKRLGMGFPKPRLKANSLPTLFLPEQEGEVQASLSSTKEAACSQMTEESMGVAYKCCVVGCEAAYWHDVKVWHALPQRLSVRAAWLTLIGCSESSVCENARVCGQHFAPSAYKHNPSLVEGTGTGFAKHHLKWNALPTLFLPKREVSHQESERPAGVFIQASSSQLSSGGGYSPFLFGVKPLRSWGGWRLVLSL
ncbi:uncharacterized protein LOC144150981 isoform X2 [Haemaphysalis longicornis]